MATGAAIGRERTAATGEDGPGGAVSGGGRKAALLALAVGAFGIGTTEFSPMGLLPIIASGLDVSIPRAGLLVSAYAIGVMVGAPVMTLALGRLPRRDALIALMAIFTIGNALSAIAPSYDALMAGRVVTSLAHGAFFGLGSIVAAGLVAPQRRASAIAAMFMGLTIANIGGVPAASWVGQHIGWRAAFGGIAALGLVAITALLLALPRGAASGKVDLRRELRILTEARVLPALGTTILGAGAMFTLYTYVAATLQATLDASGIFIAVSLALIGIGFTVGNWLGGRLSSLSVDGAAAGCLAALGIVMLALPALLVSHAGAAMGLLVWGAAAFAVVPAVQTRIMQAAAGAPALASSVNIGAFSLGNALGAALGGAVIANGLGYRLVPDAGAVLAFLGLTLVGWTRRMTSRPD